MTTTWFLIVICSILVHSTYSIRFELVNHQFPIPQYDVDDTDGTRLPPDIELNSIFPLSPKFAIASGGRIIVELTIQNNEKSSSPSIPSSPKTSIDSSHQGMTSVYAIRNMEYYYVFSMYTTTQLWHASNDVILGSVCNHPAHVRYVIPQNGSSVSFKIDHTVELTQLFFPVLERCRPYIGGKSPKPILVTGNITMINPDKNHLSWNSIPLPQTLSLLSIMFLLFTAYNFEKKPLNLLHILVFSTFCYGLYFALSAIDLSFTSMHGYNHYNTRAVAYIFYCLADGGFILFSILISYGITVIQLNLFQKEVSFLLFFFLIFLAVNMLTLPCYMNMDTPPSLEVAGATANPGNNMLLNTHSSNPVGSFLLHAISTISTTNLTKYVDISLFDIVNAISLYSKSFISTLKNVLVSEISPTTSTISTTQTEEDVDWCRTFSVSSVVLNFLVTFGIVFAITTRIERLHHLIPPSGADSRVTLVRLKIYYRFRWAFIFYLLIPVIVLILSFSAFSWLDLWFQYFLHHFLVLCNYTLLISSGYYFNLLVFENSGRLVTGTEATVPPNMTMIKKLNSLLFPAASSEVAGNKSVVSSPRFSSRDGYLDQTPSSESINDQNRTSDTLPHMTDTQDTTNTNSNATASEVDVSYNIHGPGINIHLDSDFQSYFPYFPKSYFRKFLSFITFQRWK